MSLGQAAAVRVVLLCTDPEVAGVRSEGVSCILEDLGCRVTRARLDLDDLDIAAVALHPPTIVVVELGDQLSMVRRVRTRLSECEPLSGTPSLLVLPLERLVAIDFSLGFDDFLLSPIVPAEMYARLRQLDWKAAAFGSDEIVKVGTLVIDIAGYEVHLGGRRIDFTHQEFELLRFLAQNRGRVYSREQLLQTVWGYQYGGGTRTVDIHVRRVRAKLGAVGCSSDGGTAGLIVTVRNVGYKMR